MQDDEGTAFVAISCEGTRKISIMEKFTHPI